MRGGGSALFGSSAIAGTINIITKKPSRNSAVATHTISSIGGSSALDNNTSLNASLVSDDNKMGMASTPGACVSTGFLRTPHIECLRFRAPQAFDEDLHIDNVGALCQ